MSSEEKQRLDIWLFFARIQKSRARAARLVNEGHVRVNGRRVDTAAKPIRPGDVLTISLEHRVRVLRVIKSGSRRGPFTEARGLFEEIS